MVLPVVVAERFTDVVSADKGATEPIKMTCRSESGQLVDAFVKCASPQCTPGGLVRELLGCLLADRLGFEVGAPLLVEVPGELVEVMRGIYPMAATKLSNSVSPLFGSRWLGDGYQICRPPIGSDVANQRAKSIWAFDQLILNVDRNLRKPNCLISGDRIALIDHEKALVVDLVGTFLSPAPWEPSWAPLDHLFHEIVRKGPIDFDSLKCAWDELSSEDIEGLIFETPISWDIEVRDQIHGYLIDLKEHLDQAFFNLERVLQ